MNSRYHVSKIDSNTKVPDGMILSPYLSVDITNTKRDEYDIFMKQYNNDHKYCPKCGSESYSCTLVGYILDLNKKEEYKDRNTCICSYCGDTHIIHDRVKNNEHKDSGLKYCFCGNESCYLEPGFDLCGEHLDDV